MSESSPIVSKPTPPTNRLPEATVEILSGIVRVGADHHAYGDPFEFAVAFSSADGKTAVVKALVANDAEFKSRYAHEIIRALRLIGLKAVWTRNPVP